MLVFWGVAGYVLVHLRRHSCSQPALRAVVTAKFNSPRVAIPVEMIRGLPVEAAFSISVDDYFQTSYFVRAHQDQARSQLQTRQMVN